MKDVLIEEVFRLLEAAKRLEATGCHRIETATKYYEACYVMRQILASGALSSGSQQETPSPSEMHSTSSTVSNACKRLLEGKIDHYTKVARSLYFDNHCQQQQQQPPTSVIIELLDDTISVLTPPTVTLSAAAVAPEAKACRRVRFDSAPPGAQRVHHPNARNHCLPTPSHGNNNNNNNNKSREKLPKFALAASERKIQLHTNLAHSKLSQALDLDEKHRRQPKNNRSYWESRSLVRKNVCHPYNRECSYRAAAIEAYVEASELYLGAIRLAETQQSRLSSSSPRSGSNRFVRTLMTSVHDILPKLKRLLASTLDRIEALKREKESSRKVSFVDDNDGRRASPTTVMW